MICDSVVLTNYRYSSPLFFQERFYLCSSNVCHLLWVFCWLRALYFSCHRKLLHFQVNIKKMCVCNSWQFWSSQLIQSHYNLILHILHYIMLHTLLKTVQLLWILFKDFFPQLVHLIQLLLMKTKQTTKYTLVIAFLAFGGSKRCLFLFFLNLKWALLSG